MRSRIAWVIGGAFLSLIYAAVMGFLTLRMIGVRGGAVLGLDNSLAAITTPRPGVLESVTMTVVSCVVLGLLVFAARRRPVADQFAFRLGFATATLAQLVVSSIMQVTTYTFLRGPDDEFTLWWAGWLLKIGINPAAYLTLAVSLFLVVISVRLLSAQKNAVTANASPTGHHA